jgi:hypothetical protein
LKEAAAALPCFAALHWPDYATKVFDDTLNGKPIVVQLWKGWCQQFLSSPNFPGGIGGEVGIYERVTGKGFPAERPDWCPQGFGFSCNRRASSRTVISFGPLPKPISRKSSGTLLID